MSRREPESSAMRASQVLGGWSNAVSKPEPPPPAEPPRGPQRRRNFKIVVEPEKPKPKRPDVERGQRALAQHYESAVRKQLTTTEALTDEERQIISGYRLSVGGKAAEAERLRIEKEVRGR